MTTIASRLKFQWHRGWREIPEIMCASFYFVVGTTGICYYMYKMATTDMQNKRYKTKYFIYRPDDPKLERVRRFADSPRMTSSTEAENWQIAFNKMIKQ